MRTFLADLVEDGIGWRTSRCEFDDLIGSQKLGKVKTQPAFCLPIVGRYDLTYAFIEIYIYIYRESEDQKVSHVYPRNLEVYKCSIWILMLQPYFNFSTFKRRSSSRGGLETLAGRLSGNLAKRFRSAKQCVDISAVHGMGFDKDLKENLEKPFGTPQVWIFDPPAAAVFFVAKTLRWTINLARSLQEQRALMPLEASSSLDVGKK